MLASRLRKEVTVRNDKDVSAECLRSKKENMSVIATLLHSSFLRIKVKLTEYEGKKT